MSNSQHNALEGTHTFSSTTHSTATSPDVVGPGRTLGLLFDWLGKGLESFLNRRASQLNLGPEAVARDIRRIRRHEETSSLVRYAAPYAHLTRAQDKKIRKLCKILLKYTSAFRALADYKFNALNEIMKLSMEDRMLNAGYLVPIYKEVELSIAISKAIHSIEYAETHELWSRFQFLPDFPWNLSSITPEHFNSLKNSLSNRDSSFLAARYLSGVIKQAVADEEYILSDLLDHYFDLTVTSPYLIEWSNVNACGNMPRHWTHTNESWLSRSDIIVELIRNSLYLRDFFEVFLVVKVIKFRTNGPDDDECGEPFSFEKGGAKGVNTIVVPAFRTFLLLKKLLKTLTDSNDYLTHLSYIGSRDGRTQKAMKDIFIGDEIFLIFMCIWEYIETEGLTGQQCLLMHDNPTQIRNSNAECNCNHFEHAASLLDFYCKSDQVKLEDRALAIFLKKLISSASRYYKLTLCREIARPLSFSEIHAPYWDLFGTQLADHRFGNYSEVLWRFRSNGKYFFLDAQLLYRQKSCISNFLQTECIDRVDATVLSCEMVTSFMRPDLKSQFNSTSHYPILAFYDDSGVPFYLVFASRFTKERGMRHFFTSVKDGDTVATWYDEIGRANITSDFKVLVLRHDPIDFPVGRNDFPWGFTQPRTGSVDPTGPIYWLQYFPERDPEFFDIGCREQRETNKIILSQNGESALAKSPWLQDSSPCRCWRDCDEVESCSSQDHMESDDDEPNVSSLGIDAEEYYNEENSDSSSDEVPGPRMDGQSFPCWNEDSEIRENITEDTERSVEAEGGFDANPIPIENISIERLQRVVEERDLELEEKDKELEEKDKEIARLRLMLSNEFTYAASRNND
ncbi:hypothetical protein SCHPADRAFT_891022 [Schizopora paradoxa]|uniref:Uncharacterized protein n=1 Tax=Schizopora paradoxa TaxID=27342 RepID=A0A0H2RRL9_9AGAM|nr:hypothetical protein SCHPADRAFT_891022 [Schizopora paradoxa]